MLLQNTPHKCHETGLKAIPPFLCEMLMKQLWDKEVFSRSQKSVLSVLPNKFHFPQRGWWKIPQHSARWRSVLMVEFIEKFIVETLWASHPPLGQWLSTAKTSPVSSCQGAALFAGDGCVCFLCSAKPCAGSCGSFNSQLNLGRSWPAQYLPSLWPASGTGPGGC